MLSIQNSAIIAEELRYGDNRKTDEENLGFTYAVLDKYIRTGEIENKETKEIIDKKHKMNLFKLQLMPVFDPGIETKA